MLENSLTIGTKILDKARHNKFLSVLKASFVGNKPNGSSSLNTALIKFIKQVNYSHLNSVRSANFAISSGILFYP